jgi:hypothetical protein
VDRLQLLPDSERRLLTQANAVVIDERATQACGELRASPEHELQCGLTLCNPRYVEQQCDAARSQVLDLLRKKGRRLVIVEREKNLSGLVAITKDTVGLELEPGALRVPENLLSPWAMILTPIATSTSAQHASSSRATVSAASMSGQRAAAEKRAAHTRTASQMAESAAESMMPLRLTSGTASRKCA